MPQVFRLGKNGRLYDFDDGDIGLSLSGNRIMGKDVDTHQSFTIACCTGVYMFALETPLIDSDTIMKLWKTSHYASSKPTYIIVDYKPPILERIYILLKTYDRIPSVVSVTSFFNKPIMLDKDTLLSRIQKCYFYADDKVWKMPHSLDVAYNWTSGAQKVANNPTKTLMGEYITFHTFGYHGIFKPSAGEVLSQLPSDVFDNEHVSLLLETEPAYEGNPSLCLFNDELHIGLTRVFTWL